MRDRRIVAALIGAALGEIGLLLGVPYAAAVAAGLPAQVGQCSETKISKIEQRLQDGLEPAVR